jgi:cellulose biosynthesis protein BcsQ
MRGSFFVVSSDKGGSGKSTTSILLGRLFAASGRQVLLVDLEGRGDTTRYHLAGRVAPPDRTIVACLAHGDARSCILPSHIINTDILANSPYLSERARDMTSESLRDILEPVRDEYDAIIIDSPGQIPPVVVSALNLADKIVTPAGLHGFDLTGLLNLRAVILRETSLDLANWHVFLNGVRDPRVTEQRSLDIQYHAEFTRMLENMSAVRIPRLAQLQDVTRGALDIRNSGRTKQAYDRLVQLGSEIAGEQIVPENGYF